MILWGWLIPQFVCLVGMKKSREPLQINGFRDLKVTPIRRINPKPKHFCLGFVIPREKI